MSMPDFGTLDVDLRQKVPKNSDFFILPEKSVFCQGKIIDDTIARTSIRPLAQPPLSLNLRGKLIRVLREFLSERSQEVWFATTRAVRDAPPGMYGQLRYCSVSPLFSSTQVRNVSVSEKCVRISPVSAGLRRAHHNSPSSVPCAPNNSWSQAASSRRLSSANSRRASRNSALSAISIRSSHLLRTTKCLCCVRGGYRIFFALPSL